MTENNEQNGTTRRDFLKYVVVGGVILVSASIATPVVGYFLSPTWQKKATKTIPVARVDEIPIG
jgi:hypothetical protein